MTGIAYQEFNLKEPGLTQTVEMRAMADTGAQMCILGMEQVHMLGMKEKDLEPANLGINTANGGQARNLGMLFLEIVPATPHGCPKTTR